MELTRRGAFFVALAVALAVVAAVLAEPLPLFGTAGIGAVLLAAQLEASDRFRTAREQLSVTVTPGASHTRVGRSEPVLLEVSRAGREDAARSIEVRLELPVGVDAPGPEGRTLRLAGDETGQSHTVAVRFDTAGTFRFPAARVALEDELGLFTETIPVEVDATVRAEPETDGTMHVGRGGDAVTAAYGEHASDRTGPGLVPEELRRYVAGDPAQWIDWKSTARLTEPYVREFEVETDRRTTLLVDTRLAVDEATAAGVRMDGTDGPGAASFLREAALAIAGIAQANGDPLGLWLVDDAGYTRVETAARSPDGYARVREALFDLPDVADGRGEASSDGRNRAVSGGSRGVGAGRQSVRQPAEATRLTRRLAGEETAFARTMRAFTASAEAYVSHVTDDPLFEAARDASVRTTDGLTVVVCDDARRNRIRETLPLVTRGNNYALVLCLPRVLFGRTDLADLETAYERYLEFESFRRDLEGYPRVTALEVGPRDRIDAILAARRAGGVQ